jgi:2-polyprenyl-3-methyl-5-hydroxy-6-metoxy-1,4-benzoquinol methylase
MSAGEQLRDRVLSRIYSATPTQKKKIERFFVKEPYALKDLEEFLGIYAPFLASEGVSPEALADGYLEMVDQMLAYRLEFLRTGEYPSKDQASALAKVYSDGVLMTQYMFGVALSLFLWEHHYRMLKFYIDAVEKEKPEGSFLEVGCGHGYFLLELLKRSSRDCLADAVDISATSIALAKGILASVDGAMRRRVSFFNMDLAKFAPEKKYSFITMGEVLEHVDDPLALLKRLRDLVSEGGTIFVTTCANCPSIDHVHHFHTIQEIRDMIALAGLRIKKELVTPSEEKNEADLIKHKIDIAYAALLDRV